MSSASSRVLGTYELLEAILSFLPFRDLVTSQRVSSQFKAVVGGSIQLQQKLYLSPVPEDTTTSDHPLKDAVFGSIDSIPSFTSDWTLHALEKDKADAPHRMFCPFNFTDIVSGNLPSEVSPCWSMYTTQPPTKEMHTDSVRAKGLCHDTNKIVKDKGITFGDLLKVGKESRRAYGKDVYQGLVFLCCDGSGECEGSIWIRSSGGYRRSNANH